MLHRSISLPTPVAFLCSLGVFLLGLSVAEGREKGKAQSWWGRNARPQNSGFRKATSPEKKAIRIAMKAAGITKPLGKSSYVENGKKYRVLGLSLGIQIAEKPSPNGGRQFEVFVRNRYSRTGRLRPVNPRKLVRGELGPGVLEGHIFPSKTVKLHEWSVPYTGRLYYDNGASLDVSSSR